MQVCVPILILNTDIRVERREAEITRRSQCLERPKEVGKSH